MFAEILAVGSELTSGQKLDTNSQWISRRLGELGIATRFHTALGDDLEDNRIAFRNAIGRADLVIVSGGLGPTQDDLTREVLAEVAGVPLDDDPEALAAIERFFRGRNRAMTESNRLQARFPRGSEVLNNPIGTAPGIWLKVGGAIVACLPGVPYELFRMFEEQVVPRLRRDGHVRRVIVHRVINLFGRGEAEIEQGALDLTARGHVPEVGITASDATISFRITAEGDDEEQARRAIEPVARTIYERFAPLIVGEGKADVADALAAELVRTGCTVATAESCTGGLIAHRLTGIPGISRVYPGGVVSYSVATKASMLGLDAAWIGEQGVVSEAVATAMAEAVALRLGADVGIGVTGVAGPGLDDDGNPPGLVFIAAAIRGKTFARRLELGPEQPRDVIRSRAAKHAMNLARFHLRDLPPAATTP
ncbi:MAG: competence/damage-inducible protein A [Isosphaeraceae bacterium]